MTTFQDRFRQTREHLIDLFINLNHVGYISIRVCFKKSRMHTMNSFNPKQVRYTVVILHNNFSM